MKKPGTFFENRVRDSQAAFFALLPFFVISNGLHLLETYTSSSLVRCLKKLSLFDYQSLFVTCVGVLKS